MLSRSAFIMAGWTALLGGGAGCASLAERAPEMPGGVPSADERASCPMLVPGTKITVEDTPGSVALTFTTGHENVEELRDSVHRWAHMHAVAQSTMPRRAGSGHGGMIGGHGMYIASSARVEDVPDGARVVLTPRHPDDLDRLRAESRAHEEPMGAGNLCMGMMQGRGSP